MIRIALISRTAVYDDEGAVAESYDISHTAGVGSKIKLYLCYRWVCHLIIRVIFHQLFGGVYGQGGAMSSDDSTAPEAVYTVLIRTELPMYAVLDM